jgi:PAS domain S-box-containing protein
VYERFTQEVQKLIPFDRVAINIVNPEDRTVTIAYVAGVEIAGRRKGDVVPLTGTATEEVLRVRSSLIIQTEDKSEIADRFPGLLPSFASGLRSMMMVPLTSRDQVIGVLHLRSTQSNAYTERDLKLAERVGNQIAGAIANAQLFKELNQAEEAVRRSKEFSETVFNSMHDAISIVNVHNFKIIDVNQVFHDKLGMKKDEVIGRVCYEITHRRSDPCTPPDDICPLLDMLKTGKPSVAEHVHYAKNGEKMHVEVFTSPIINGKGEIVQAVHVARDITDRKRAEEEREKLILQLQEALTKVKTLRGLLPICASCKKIRDDKGYWTQIEAYIRDRSEAEFSHGICPECVRKLYPDLSDEENKKDI